MITKQKAMITKEKALNAVHDLSSAHQCCLVGYYLADHIDYVADLHFIDAEIYFRKAAYALGFDLVERDKPLVSQETIYEVRRLEEADRKRQSKQDASIGMTDKDIGHD